MNGKWINWSIRKKLEKVGYSNLDRRGFLTPLWRDNLPAGRQGMSHLSERHGICVTLYGKWIKQ